MVEREEDILILVANYYKNLFTSHAGTRIDEHLEYVTPKVTGAMNRGLLAPFTEDEVKA